MLWATRKELVALLARDFLDYFVHKLRIVLSLLASDFGQLLPGRTGLDVRPGWRVIDALQTCMRVAGCQNLARIVGAEEEVSN